MPDTILLVEDTENYYDSWGNYLKRNDFNVFIPTTPEMAVKMARDSSLILLDWKLDEGQWNRNPTNGGIILDQIRKEMLDQIPPVAMFTQYRETEEMKQYMEKHDLFWISKVFSENEIIRIREIIDHNKMAKQIPHPIRHQFSIFISKVVTWINTEPKERINSSFVAILHGAPGSGKTTFAKDKLPEILRNKVNGYKIYSRDFTANIKHHTLANHLYGKTMELIIDQFLHTKDLFNKREIIVWYIDEAECLFPCRVNVNNDIGHMNTDTLNTQISLCDQNKDYPMVLILTTNLIDRIDKSLLDRSAVIAELPLPNYEQASTALRRILAPKDIFESEMGDELAYDKAIDLISREIVDRKLGYRSIEQLRPDSGLRSRKGRAQTLSEYIKTFQKYNKLLSNNTIPIVENGGTNLLEDENHKPHKEILVGNKLFSEMAEDILFHSTINTVEELLTKLGRGDTLSMTYWGENLANSEEVRRLSLLPGTPDSGRLIWELLRKTNSISTSGERKCQWSVMVKVLLRNIGVDPTDVTKSVQCVIRNRFRYIFNKRQDVNETIKKLGLSLKSKKST